MRRLYFMILFSIFATLLSSSKLNVKDSKIYMTKMDFEDTSIDGKVKVPKGFLLHGRGNNSLYSMIHLRKNFTKEIEKSSKESMFIVVLP